MQVTAGSLGHPLRNLPIFEMRRERNPFHARNRASIDQRKGIERPSYGLDLQSYFSATFREIAGTDHLHSHGCAHQTEERDENPLRMKEARREILKQTAGYGDPGKA